MCRHIAHRQDELVAEMWRLLLVLAACACSVPSRPARAPASSSTRADPAPPAAISEPFPIVSPFRLPHTFEPRAYRARLALGAHRFTGHIEITGDLSEAVALIWLHGVGLVVTDARAVHGDVVIPLEASPPRADQLLGLLSETALAAGRWTISLDYEGPIHDQESPVATPNGLSMVDPPALGVFRRVVGSASYVFTQSEPIYARWIFPCIDEPDRKVPWQLTLDVDKDLVAASNTQIVRESELDPAHKRVEFAETAPLPSYVIAFAVGPFDIIDARPAKKGTPIRILALHGHAAAIASALRLAPQILDRLETWLGVPYPYGKLDLVAVPHAGWGAMENPGLVTFNQEDIESAQPTRVIAHELAHQWFGDLVTLAWWDDIWLNESFAELLSDKIGEQLDPSPEPEARVDEHVGATASAQRGVSVVRRIASSDDLEFRRFAPQEVLEKGAALLRLFEAYFGPEPFRHAIRSYVAAHANGSVTTADLSRALSDEAGKRLEQSIASMLDIGAPTLDVTLICEGPPHLRIDCAPAELPVCVAYDKDGKRAEVCAQLDDALHDLALPAKRCPLWVLPNVAGIGPYYARWTQALLGPLVDSGWSHLSPAERRMLFGELRDTSSQLAVFVKLASDGSAQTIPNAAWFLDGIAKYVPRDLEPAFDARIEAWFGAQARALHFKQVDDVGYTARREPVGVVHLVARTQDPQLVHEARPIAAHFHDLPPDYPFLEPVLALAANGDPKFVKALLDDLAVRGRADPTLRGSIIDALSATPGVVGFFKEDPQPLASLEPWEATTLFSNVCDSDDRKVLAALASKMSLQTSRVALGEVDQCLATKATLEPLLRLWLGRSTNGTPARRTVSVPSAAPP